MYSALKAWKASPSEMARATASTGGGTGERARILRTWRRAFSLARVTASRVSAGITPVNRERIRMLTVSERGTDQPEIV